MNWIVAAVIALLLIIIGFAVIHQIQKGANALPNAASGVQCRVTGGTCATSCTGSATVVAADCAGGTQCCVAG